jgi:hypothetical protein
MEVSEGGESRFKELDISLLNNPRMYHSSFIDRGILFVAFGK